MIGDYMLHAASCVVKRNRLNLRVMLKEIAALIKRDRMRQDAPQGAQWNAGRRNHVVHNPQQVFGLNEYSSCDQQICMLGDRARERILNRDHRRLNRFLFDAVKYIRRARARHHGATPQHPLGCFMAERTQFSLNRNFHMQGKLSGEAGKGQLISGVGARSILSAR